MLMLNTRQFIWFYVSCNPGDDLEKLFFADKSKHANIDNT